MRTQVASLEVELVRAVDVGLVLLAGILRVESMAWPTTLLIDSAPFANPFFRIAFMGPPASQCFVELDDRDQM